MQLHMNLTCHETEFVSNSMAFTHILKMKNHSWTSVMLQQNFYDKMWAALQQSLPIQFADDSPIPIFEEMGTTTLCIFHWASVFAVRILRELLGEMTELSSVPDKNFAWTFPNLKWTVPWISNQTERNQGKPLKVRVSKIGRFVSEG